MPEEVGDSYSAASKEIQQAVDAITSTQPAKKKRRFPWSIVLGESRNLPNANPTPEEIDKEEEGRFRRDSVEVQWCLFLATFAAFGAAAYYASVAADQRDKMDDTFHATLMQANAAVKGNDLIRQEMKATLGANLEPRVRLVSGKTIRIEVENTGQSVARKVRTSVTVVREYIPSHTPVIEEIKYKPHFVDITPLSRYAGAGITQVFRDRDIIGLDIALLRRAEQAVTVNVTMTYDDGFGVPLQSVHVCESFFAVPPYEGGGLRADGEQHRSCDSIQSALDELAKWKREQKK